AQGDELPGEAAPAPMRRNPMTEKTEGRPQVSLGQVLHINCPAWSRRQDFRAFLNQQTQWHARQNPAEAFWGLATWHRPGDEPGETSDVFLVYDGGSGDSEAMPQDVWAEVCRLAQENGFEYALVWISNCSGTEGA